MTPSSSSTPEHEAPKAWGDDVALRGPNAPKNDGKIKHLIEYLLTVYERFGNTVVTADLQWGATALHKLHEERERIEALEAELATLRSIPSETATTSNPQNGGKATPSAGTSITGATPRTDAFYEKTPERMRHINPQDGYDFACRLERMPVWEEVERRSIGMQHAIEPGDPVYALVDGRWYRLVTPPLSTQSARTPTIPDVELLLDNAATASQVRELLRNDDGEETALREAVRRAVYEPLAVLIRRADRNNDRG